MKQMSEKREENCHEKEKYAHKSALFYYELFSEKICHTT